MQLFGKTKGGAGMSNRGGPSVCVVDTYSTRPSLPPRTNQPGGRPSWSQTLLFLLVSLALCGMVIEACFIYRLHQSDSAASPVASKLKAGGEVKIPKTKSRNSALPSKPAAHLTDGVGATHGKKIMGWSVNARHILNEMQYRQKNLIIQKEGYYFVYSKVFFVDNGTFYHSVEMHTQKYEGGSILLLQSRKYSPPSNLARSNSFLCGVFKLDKDDALFVKVSDTKKLVRHNSFEHVFGAYMI